MYWNTCVVVLVFLGFTATVSSNPTRGKFEDPQVLLQRTIDAGPEELIRRSMQEDPNLFQNFERREDDPAKLAKKYKFYQRPLYRYPYYEKDGKGHLLYGYGGPELFSYSVFQPLEGYYKK